MINRKRTPNPNPSRNLNPNRIRKQIRSRSRLRLLDLLDETLAGIFARPARAALTTAGTVIGLASLVATLGVSRTAGEQILQRFDELEATQVIVRASSSALFDADATTPLPWSVEERLDRLNGVVASGAVADVAEPNGVRTVPVVDPTESLINVVPVLAASSGLLDALRGHVSSGRFFDQGHVDRVDAVAVIGADLAAVLGIRSVDDQPGIFLGEHLFSVIGIIDASPRDVGLLGAVTIPSSTAARLYGTSGPDRVVIETRLGAAGLIATQAPTALNPDDPTALTAVAPSSPERTRNGVASDVNGLFVLLGLISLLVGAIGIANVTLVTVMERTGEIGLRRALGARRRHIAAQVLCESAAMGLVGGIIGASAGITTVVVVSAQRDWTPLLDPVLPLLAPAAGASVGLIAGLYPSVRAARMEPVEALRSGL